MPLLSVQGLEKTFKYSRGGKQHTVQAVRNVDFDLQSGETLGIVGESGSGKSTTVRLVARLLKADKGTISLNGEDATSAKGRRLRELRKRMPMVFQDPYSSLDPSWIIERTLLEPSRSGVGRHASYSTDELLEMVKLPRSFKNRYPYELSGGQRQRIAIARALGCSPEVLICDEAVAALDVSTRAGIVELLAEIKQETGVGILFVTHDLSLVEAISDRVLIMYFGEIVERGDVAQIYDAPKHPYTKLLLDSIPIPDPTKQKGRSTIISDGRAPFDPD